MRGVLITFEGVEGSGKSTQMRRLERWLRREGYRPEITREPDGTALGAAVRRLFERPGVKPQPLSEMFLFMAARQQHVIEKIGPWLRAGRVVLCDRYTDATVAYQGYGRGVDPELIREMNTHATGGVFPDLTVLFDLDPAAGFRRIGARLIDDGVELHARNSRTSARTCCSTAAGPPAASTRRTRLGSARMISR